MADKRGLLGYGFSGSAPKRRDPGAATSEAATHPEGNSNLPDPLSEAVVLNRRRQFPWASYVGPASFSGTNAVHFWRCDLCERGGAGVHYYRMRDSDTFRIHANRLQHRNAAEAEALASSLRTSREDSAVQRAVSIASSSGKLLVIVCFMIIHGISLRIFPKVCSPALLIS
jgi:hypothetical protein